ncbi:MAG: hypothetical protein QM808_12900 [Steroidobacteraceae bacterium]
MQFLSMLMRLHRKALSIASLGLLALGSHTALAQTPTLQVFPDAPKMGSFVGAATRDPLENYYGNTVVCAAAQTGQDLCHLWLYPDGTFINFDSNGAKTGHYTVGPVRADGKVPVCQYWDTPDMIIPKELQVTMGGPAPAAAPAAAGGMAAGAAGPAPGGAPSAAAGMGAGAPGGMICKNENHRTTCYRGVDTNTLSDDDKKLVNLTMGERFYRGMCYPLGPHNVGDVWFEFDDPLPGQLGLDKMFMLPGHQ